MISKREQGMTLIVKTVTRLTLGFILLYGIYIALSGHMSPGGGFAGGIIVALSFVHVMLAFGKDAALEHLHSYVMRIMISVGALLFLVMVFVKCAGPRVGAFCPILNNKIMMPVCEMAIVGYGIFAIFVALVLLSKTDQDAE
jgi:multisubunit Na+/H+ antiporter MnhB subunit